MLMPAPPLFPRKRKSRKLRPSNATPVPAGPVLVSATWGGEAGVVLTMTFDRAIDVDAFAPGDVFVYDGPGGVEWGGTGVFEQPTPQSIAVTTIENGEFSGAGVSLTVTGGAGIVAEDDDAPWAGVADVGLPFP